jgi:hypothetical protein
MKYLAKLGFTNVEQVFWFDTETSSAEKEITENSPFWAGWKQKLQWDEKITKDSEVKFRYSERAPIYKEFGKVVAIAYGRVVGDKLRVKRLHSDNEKQLLEDFMKDVSTFVNGGMKFLGGFSIGQFDIPFIEFRCRVNGVEVHPFFDTAGLKSWDIKHITDVQELLRGTSSTSISLQGASAVFGLESPKTLLAGEEVNSLYWSEDKDRLEKISTYASKDTLTACNLLCKLLNQPIKELELVAEKEVVVEELPLLQKINNSKNIGEKEKEELKQIFTKKKLTKKDKDIIFDLIRASLAEIDSNFGKVVNQKQIDEIINQLKEEFESN